MSGNGQHGLKVSGNAKPDRRVVRTRAALRKALFELLHEKSWNAINVRMICERADIARSSFYLHFQNKQELLDFGFQTNAEQAMSEILDTKSDNAGFATMQWLTNHIYSGRSFFKEGHEYDEVIYVRFQKSVATMWTEELKLMDLNVDDEGICFVMGGCFALLRKWVASGCATPPDDIAALQSRLANRVLAGQFTTV